VTHDRRATPFVLQDRDDRGVVTLTLNRPASFNALSEGMLGALEQALGEIAADETVRAVVIAASGKAFCAGHDLKKCAPSRRWATTSGCSSAAAR
jgi:enoyl-CoA hydratase/carnithine racemase